ncbi:thiamine pyrophosphate-binding protein [Azospirillum sp. SYSU D00513]|uniref:thiamine pyrophosphate-binding protein n=1 Tax=Azospirillum sp. SYSU D00513 TaxID=2812561 RepID=UPI001FFE8512|nr:thiamine pyrophosphate-binding protein [Azospirillum sp. SYSU D00513]
MSERDEAVSGAAPGTMSGGALLVACLRAHGARRAFCVPGESYLEVIDAFHDHPDLDVVVCRQEGGAAMMAEAHGKLTGEPGICFVTRGPGATNASAGVHVASQDSTPMILFVGQVARGQMEREAFQELDYRQVFGSMVKWAAQIDEAERIPEFIGRAFAVATAGRPGPVVLALPEDMLRDMVTPPADLGAHAHRRADAYPGPDAMDRLRAMLAEAERPLVIVGGSGWTEEARSDFQRFIEANGLPVAASFRRQDLFDNGHPNYAGDVGVGVNPALARRVRECDLLISVGSRLSEMVTSGYSLVAIPRPAQSFVHVHPDPEELGRVYQADLPVNASLRAFAHAAAAMPPVEPRWADWTRQARADYEAWQQPKATPGRVQMGEVMRQLNERLPDDAILTNGAGNYTVWPHRFHRHRRLGTQLAPTSGSMGYGLPAAIAAKREHPDRTVVAFAGDGCFQMTVQELGTAVQYGVNVLILVINNGIYGTIQMHQERRHPGRARFTDLVNPDFAALARAYGAHGELVEETAGFAPALERALKAGKPALIELRTDPEAITPNTTLTALRETARAGGPR